MQRFKALAVFGVWVAGLGYAAMWALTGPLDRAAAVDLHPETLSPLVHLVGVAAVLAVCARLVGAARRPPRQNARNEPRPRRRMRRPGATVKRVKARDHFGLRGVQH